MVTVKTISGEAVRIGRKLLSHLSMMSDWQIRECGYDPDSITSAILNEENK